MDNSLYILDNIVLQVSESLEVHIVAGWPIHCRVPGLDHSLLNKLAVHSTLDTAKTIAVSHQGLLSIAETGEPKKKKNNRIQQITTNGEISVVAGAPADCDCKIDPNCDCFSGEWTGSQNYPNSFKVMGQPSDIKHISLGLSVLYNIMQVHLGLYPMLVVCIQTLHNYLCRKRSQYSVWSYGGGYLGFHRGPEMKITCVQFKLPNMPNFSCVKL